MNNDVYEITVKNWKKHHAKHKVGMQYAMLKNTIFYDPAFAQASTTAKLLFIFLITCCSDRSNSTVTLTKHQLNFSGSRGNHIQNMLDQLQSLQLLTYTLIKEKRKEEIKLKRREGKSPTVTSAPPPEQLEILPKETLPKLAQLWNQYAIGLAPVKKTNAHRDKQCKALWPKNTEAEWVEIIQRVADSQFCQGKNDRAWVATFDWFLKTDTYLKVSEGKYDNRIAKNMTASEKRAENLMKMYHDVDKGT